MARDIVEMLEFGCPFKPGTLGEKDAEFAEAVMQIGADEIISLRRKLTAATERAEKAESQRDRMREALERMVGLWERVHSPQVLLGRPTLNAAKKALKGEVGDE